MSSITKILARNANLASRIALILACYTLAPAAAGQIPATTVDFSKGTSEIPVTKWRFVGPFPYKADDLKRPGADDLPVGLNRDYLKEDFGISESSITEKGFTAVGTTKRDLVLDRRFKSDVMSSEAETNVLELAWNGYNFDYVVGYAAVEVDSLGEQDIVIAAGVRNSMKVWLNDELLFADSNTVVHGLTKYQRLIGAHLQKGRNFLLIKACNRTKAWRLVVNFEPANRGLRLAEENGVNPILATSVAPVGGNVMFRGDLLPKDSSIGLQLLNFRHKQLVSEERRSARRMDVSASKLEWNQLYYARVSYAGGMIERPFFYGDPAVAYERFQNKVSRLGPLNEEISIDLQAALIRLDYLLKPDNRTSGFWSQNVARCIVELENGLAQLEGSPGTFLHAAGTHVRGYRSAVDAQVQYYWIHVPAGALASGKPIPLVIALPYVTSDNAAFLASYFVTAWDEAERYRMLSDEYGYAVLQVWGRGNRLGDRAMGTADVFDALDAVTKDYSIDRDRIYLLGYCEAGKLALLLAERFPGRFAAVSTYGPITVEASRAWFAQRWMNYDSPVSNVAKLVNAPVLITHDVADTVPIQDSQYFLDLCHKAGVSATLVPLHGDIHSFRQNPMAVKRSLFDFFEGKQLSAASAEANNAGQLEVGFGHGQGPIEDAFGSPFVIVEGTKGTPEQHAAVRSLVQMLSNEWRKAYFVDCPVKKDTEIAAADIQKYNLVLVGDGVTNTVVARMGKALPLQATPSSLALAGKIYEGQRLGYELALRNPLNPDKYAVMIGMNNWKDATGWRLNPPRDGICDYFIFNLGDGMPQLIDAGYFPPSLWTANSAGEPSVPLSAGTERR